MKIITLNKAVMGVVLGGILAVSTVGAAHADPHYRGPDRGYDGGWDRHAAYAHRDWYHGHPRPGYIYAPPVVYAPPPPVEESPGLSLIIPMNFR